MNGLVGIDVGGTFTDLYYQAGASSKPTVVKVPSTRNDPSLGVMDALHAAGLDPGELDTILHGTTIATNTVIERTGARCALVTTAGFRDVLELGRRDRPNSYGLAGTARPLVPRDRRFEVDERVGHDGTEIRPLDVDALRATAAAIRRSADVESVVVAFLHSYADPSHERQARDVLLDTHPDWNVVLSCDVLREHYEFERTSTAVVQGYLQPMVTRYADGLAAQLEKWGYAREVLVMQSNGGAVRLAEMGERAAHLVRSGPAAGVIAATRLAARAGFANVITGDMGGTSFDVAVVRDAEPTIAESTNLDFRLPLRLPMIDVHTIGAGGGSIAHVDRGGLLQVGPRSAGSVPGPVCLGLGGTEPTVTDANLVLGRIDPARPIGAAGTTLDLDAARDAFARLGERGGLGLDAEGVAAAVLDVVDQRMAGRIRLLSVAQGHDPRDFVLVAFGGAGPLHAASLVRAVGISSVLVPPAPGVLCAQGCVLADVRYDLSKTVNVTLDELDLAEADAVLAAQADDGAQQVGPDADGRRPDVEVRHFADMAYLGQIHTLRVPIERGWDAARLAEAFRELYRAEYGNELGELGVVCETLRTRVVGVRHPEMDEPDEPAARQAPEPASRRKVHFDGWRDTAVYDRTQLLPGMSLLGPLVVEQADATAVIDPGMSVRVDRYGNLIAEVS